MPPKRQRAKTEEDGSTSPPPKKAATKAKGKAKTSASGTKKTGAWSGDEIMRLYNVMCPKRTGVNWGEVAAAVGDRDAKSCQNKWARVQTKINEAVASIGE